MVLKRWVCGLWKLLVINGIGKRVGRAGGEGLHCMEEEGEGERLHTVKYSDNQSLGGYTPLFYGE